MGQSRIPIRSLAVLTVVGISLIGLTAAASTNGWGVDAPAVEDGTEENARTNRRAYYGGHYFIFYRTPGIRNVRSSRPGGGFQGGK